MKQEWSEFASASVTSVDQFGHLLILSIIVREVFFLSVLFCFMLCFSVPILSITKLQLCISLFLLLILEVLIIIGANV